MVLFLNLTLHALETLVVMEPQLLWLRKGLKNGKAPEPDGIKKEHLSVNISLTATILVQIFQCSVNIGELPYCWKIANVIPVYKKGDKNYRSVSLTSIVCKLLERVIASHIKSIQVTYL